MAPGLKSWAALTGSALEFFEGSTRYGYSTISRREYRTLAATNAG